MAKAKTKGTAFIAYLRVSTGRQGRSGLGLAAQRKAVMDFINGGRKNLIAEYVEVESGKRRKARPKLEAALGECRRTGATLVVAKLDRLTRNTAFLLGIAESGIDVVFCDLPQLPPGPMGRFLVTLLAAVAEFEGAIISERTRLALKAAKARGTRLGAPDPVAAVPKAAAVVRREANEFAGKTITVIREIQAAGVTTLTGLATALTARGIKTRRGGDWYPTTVRNLLRRAA